MASPLVLLLLLALPLIEIAGFVIVGSEIGVLATVALVIATTVLGSVLLRIQGFGILTRIRETMETGGEPGRDLVHGFMVMLAGVLLFLPGFFTDIIGLVLFIPPIRDLAWKFLSKRITVVSVGGFSRRPAGRPTIDLEEDEYSRRRPDRNEGPFIDMDPRDPRD